MRVLIFVLAIIAGLGQSGALAQSCSDRLYCSEMRSCAEADFHFRQCRETERDADNDGIPCENICGDTMAIYLQRRGAGGPSGAGLLSVPQPAEVACGSKRTCGQMVTCEEARAYLTQCGVRSLDRDGDGTPCESICR